MTDAAHQDLIRDQFTRQATPFSTAAPIANEAALKLIIDAARPGPDDRLLDLACGGGIVVCAFAPYLRHATGIDATPAMLERARSLAAEKGITNISWQEGEVEHLPYPDSAFTIVVTRFAMHHFLDPAARSEEHTSELQSLRHLVCRLLLEKKKKIAEHNHTINTSTPNQNAHKIQTIA